MFHDKQAMARKDGNIWELKTRQWQSHLKSAKEEKLLVMIMGNHYQIQQQQHPPTKIKTTQLLKN